MCVSVMYYWSEVMRWTWTRYDQARRRGPGACDLVVLVGADSVAAVAGARGPQTKTRHAWLGSYAASAFCKHATCVNRRPNMQLKLLAQGAPARFFELSRLSDIRLPSSDTSWLENMCPVMN